MPAPRRNQPEGPQVAYVGVLQDHRHTRGSWAVADVLVLEVPDVPGAEPDLDLLALQPGVEIAAVGDRLGLVAVGERVELRGVWEDRGRGPQLRVTEQSSRGIQTSEDAGRWLQRLDGVGPTRARALQARFGDRLPAILSGEEKADLTEVEGVGEATAQLILDSYAQVAISSDLGSLQYLESVRASRWEQTRILTWCARLRRRPKDVLQRSPFDLLRVKGLGFKRVDRLARAAGCAPTTPARLEAAAEFVLGKIVQRGSTMAPMVASRTGGLVGETLAELGLQDRQLVRDAIGRLAGAGRVVIARDGADRVWVHPKHLLDAERAIYRAAKAGRDANTVQPLGAEGGSVSSPSTGFLPSAAALPTPEEAPFPKESPCPTNEPSPQSSADAESLPSGTNDRTSGTSAGPSSSTSTASAAAGRRDGYAPKVDLKGSACSRDARPSHAIERARSSSGSRRATSSRSAPPPLDLGTWVLPTGIPAAANTPPARLPKPDLDELNAQLSAAADASSDPQTPFWT